MAQLTLKVNGIFSAGSWTQVGTTPYINEQDQPTNVIHSNGRNANSDVYTFAQSGGDLGSINWVRLYVYCQHGGAASDFATMLSGSDAGITPPASYAWVYSDVSAILTNWTQINAAQVYFDKPNTTNDPYVDAAYLLVDYNPSSTAPPTTLEPTTEAPTTLPPTTLPPTTLPPTTEAPTTLAPTTLPPTTLAPTTLEPTTLAPTTLAPTTLPPTTLAPTTEAPTTLPPTTLAPTTLPPTTLAPTTLPPTTLAPTTLPPTTLAPTTEAPTTLAPTTLPPTTLAPTTLAPTTLAPTTLAPTTLAPTTEAPSLFFDEFDDGAIDPGWTQDTGTSGAFSESNYVLTITSGSGHIYGGDYDPTWIFQEESGDFDVVVRFMTDWDTFDDTYYHRLGIMASLEGAQNNFVLSELQRTATGELRFGRVDTVNDTAYSSYDNVYKVSGFLRLQRVGSTFTTYYSSDGATWVSKTPGTVFSSSATVKVGLFASHESGQQFQVRFDYFKDFSTFSFPTDSLQDDYFDDASIDYTIWRPQGQDGGGVSESGGDLKVISSPNDIWSGANKPYGMSQYVDGDFDVVIRCDSGGSIDANYETIGMVFEIDRTNWVYIGIEYNGGLKVSAKHCTANSVSTISASIGNESLAQFLRLKRVGSTITQYYSSDSCDWTQLSPGTPKAYSGKFLMVLFAKHNVGAQFTANFSMFSALTSMTACPTTVPPTTLAPTTEEPTTLAPTTIYPSTLAPTTLPPTTLAPTTLAPTTEAPTTLASTTLVPTTEAPTTLAPTTLAPTTLAPTTLAPTTLAPTTLAPTTIAPTTWVPTTTLTTPTPTTIVYTTPVPTTAPPAPGTVCFGHDTGVVEFYIKNLASWTGTGLVVGTGDNEQLQLLFGQQKISPIHNLGVGAARIKLNKYLAGNSVFIQYKTGATPAACDADMWHSYVPGFASLGYVRVRLIR